MSIRSLMMAVAVASVMLAPPVLAETTVNASKSNSFRQGSTTGATGPAEAAANTSRSNNLRQESTTGTAGPAASTTVKSSKSNSSD